jgi:hypothetical protein
MIAETISALTGIKVAMDIAKGVSSLKTETEINQAIIDIQRALLDAQAGAFEDRQAIAKLTDEIMDLTKQLAAKADWNKEKERYVLTESEKGTFFYQLKVHSANGEVLHKVCATCFEKGGKSILQTIRKARGGEVVQCQTCEKDIKLSDFNEPVINYSRDTGGY